MPHARETFPCDMFLDDLPAATASAVAEKAAEQASLRKSGLELISIPDGEWDPTAIFMAARWKSFGSRILLLPPAERPGAFFQTRHPRQEPGPVPKTDISWIPLARSGPGSIDRGGLFVESFGDSVSVTSVCWRERCEILHAETWLAQGPDWEKAAEAARDEVEKKNARFGHKTAHMLGQFAALQTFLAIFMLRTPATPTGHPNVFQSVPD